MGVQGVVRWVLDLPVNCFLAGLLWQALVRWVLFVINSEISMFPGISVR